MVDNLVEPIPECLEAEGMIVDSQTEYAVVQVYELEPTFDPEDLFFRSAPYQAHMTTLTPPRAHRTTYSICASVP